MSALITMQPHAANYLSERRRLGFALRSPGYSVTSFARYIDALNLQEPLTILSALNSAAQTRFAIFGQSLSSRSHSTHMSKINWKINFTI